MASQPPTSSPQPILYSFYRSSCAWRVRLGLHLKNIPFETRAINLLTEENKSAEYKAIQPFGAVPAFLEAGSQGPALVESVAILEYLDETRPEFPLLPKDPAGRAVVRALVEAIAMDIQPVCQMRILKYVGKDKESEWTSHFFKEGFAAFEKMLEKTAGKYCYGDSITMADLLLVPQFYNGVRFAVDMGAYPIMSRINSELETVPAFQAAHPTKQPDCPLELR
ncbi:Glutathione S-transferase zeta-1 [Linnemannia schmuckeri]|uniref:Glutathione S-transferase zeta-1 n=1 Tax=Linnemannia schmuckeri TaxID=64567 RepID=A0A9P5RPR7_9FUNG|nr:Glutathione S-transferase zeta-1 [Linnemannia schmuckeri]